MPTRVSKEPVHAAAAPYNARKKGRRRFQMLDENDPLAKDSVSTFDQLNAAREAAIKKHVKRENTERAYQGHINRARIFLQKLVGERRENGTVLCERGIPTDELEVALDNPPNQWSGMVLSLFITDKCWKEGCGASTAECIHAAWRAHWKQMDKQYDGADYEYDEATGRVTGSPARAPEVLEVIQAAKFRGRSTEGADHQHAEAMTLDEFKTIFQHSENACPDTYLLPPLSSTTFSERVSAAQKDTVEVRLFKWKHALVRAFSSSAWTLWTRNFELCTMRLESLTFGCIGAEPHFAPFFKVFLGNRKGWQNAMSYDPPLNSNTYQIFRQDIHEVDMFTHLPRWLAFYAALLGRCHRPTDYVFPSISRNGIIDPDKPMSYERYSHLLTEFSQSAGLNRHFTTHSYRRGAAQWRFTLGQPSHRWPLSVIRWWGGWAQGEGVDTLMKYLIDSLANQETYYGDMLSPSRAHCRDSKASQLIALPRSESKCNEALSNNEDSTDRSIALLPLLPAVDKKLADLLHLLRTPGICLDQASPNTSLVAMPSPSYNNPTPRRPQFIPHEDTLAHSSKRLPPLPNIIITDLDTSSTAELPTWRQALNQWYNHDPYTGLPPLRDWPSDWYTGQMRPFTSAKRHERYLVASAFEECDSDEAKFTLMYPEAKRGFRSLTNAIRKKKGLCRAARQ